MEVEQMTRWLVVGALVTVLAGCGSPTSAAVPTVPPNTPATATQVTQFGVLVVPASRHVTGLPYPARCSYRGPLPDPVCTPGSIRSDVDPDHLELTVCKPGWSASILPPSAEFARDKRLAMTAYGVPLSELGVTEYDHKIPRNLGGSNDVTNLAPEVSDKPGKGIHNSKDEVEDKVHLAVCRGTVPWRDAVLAFAQDWTTAEKKLGVR